ncbi:MAG: hypothetical protein FJ033_05795 [Chloroflexi bacterium]|nr:hypothetical protein [Chloroflexota bacterium]
MAPSYTPSQARAIDATDRNLQIVACAGSGKTAVVSARIVNILRQNAGAGITPENLVAFTFTATGRAGPASPTRRSRWSASGLWHCTRATRTCRSTTGRCSPRCARSGTTTSGHMRSRGSRRAPVRPITGTS